MSKVPKWKIEKTKVKVVFRLQFYATHIPQTGWDKLFLSFIPAETGKATAKTNKANVRNGTCKWSDPIYEATRLLQDIRTKKYDDKIYKLVVAMGSSRASILGEADVNLAEFVDALKPSTVALPLHGCDFGTILHVTVQILTTKTGFREFEQQSVKGHNVASSHGISEPAEIVGPSSDDKINTRTRLREISYTELPAVEEATESTEDGIDGSSHTSDSLHADKTDIPLFPLTHSLNKTERDDFNPNRLSTQGSNDWGHGWASDFSDNNDLTFAYEENNRLRVRLEVAESAFLQLKSEAKSLQRITDELGAETQALARQLALELDSGQSLIREVSSLKTECSNLKRDIRELESAKSSCKALDKGSASLLVLVENKVHEIRDKACLGMCADNDFEVLLRVIGNLKQGLITQDGSDYVINQEDPLTKKEKMCELLQKLEDSKTENELLVKKMNQMERYYESYIHQLEESHKETVKELGILRDDHSSRLYTISLLQSQIEKLHEEMNDLMVKSVEERKGLEILNKELERRAIASENTLKRVRQNYTAAVDRLQKDLELLSFQVLSMYESNETLAKQPFEHSDSNLNLKLDSNLEEAPLSRFHSDNQLLLNAGLEEESKKTSRCIGIDAHTEDEILSMYVAMVQLDFFSELLIEALNGADDGVMRTKKGTLKLEMQLHESNRSLKEIEAKHVAKCDDLEVRIQILEAEVHDLTEERDKLKGLFVEESTQKGQLEAEIGALKEKINKLNQERELVEIMKLESGEKLREVEKDLEAFRTKMDFSNEVIESLQRELQDVTEKKKTSFDIEEMQQRENGELMAKLKLLEVELQQKTDEWNSLVQNLQESSIMGEELKKLQMSLLKCEEDKRALQDELRVVLETKDALESSLTQAESEVQNVIQKLKICQEIEVMKEKENRKLLSELELREAKFQQMTSEIQDLMQRLQDTNGVGEELERTKRNLSSCQVVNTALESDLKNLQEVKTNLENSLKKVESDLEVSDRKLELSTQAVFGLEAELIEVRKSFSVSSEAEQIHVQTNSELLSKIMSMEAELELLRVKNSDLMQKREIISEELERTKEVKKDLETEIEVLRETNVFLENSLQKSMSDLEASTTNLEISSKTIGKLENEVEEVREKIKISSEANSELLAKLELLERELQQVDGKSRDLSLKLESSDIVRGELEKTKVKLVACEEEKRSLENEMRILQEREVEFETLLQRVEAGLKDSTIKLDFSDKVIQNLQKEIKESTERFERENSELLSRLEFVQLELQQATEGCMHLTQKLHEADTVKDEFEKNQQNLENEIINLKFNLGEADKHVRVEKGMREELQITASYLTVQLEEKEKEMVLFFEEKTMLRGRIVELEKANIALQHLILRNEENQRDKETEFENRLLVVLEGLIASDVESSYMHCQLRELCFHLDASRKESGNVDLVQEDLILQLKEELDFLRISKEEGEILNLIFRSKLEEQNSIIDTLRESRIELGGLRENQRELTRRLSEQTLKTEEYKNLSIHLRELKEKADAGSNNQASEKRETESLRIVFIKEQYESKIQELKNQIGVSKKYAEEMLVKLQNALDEVETGKKNEIALAKRIEELSISLSELEAEMQSLRTDRRELVSAYDNLKTELECTILSFDCCKEEKSKLEACFHECNEERRKIKVELDLVKRLLENMASAENGNIHSGASNGGSIQQILGSGNGVLDGDKRGVAGVNGCSSLVGSPLSSQVPENSTIQPHKEKPENNTIDETTRNELSEKHQKLKLGLSLFQKELEKLKNENLSSLLPLGADQIDPSLHGLERALSQLDTANEHLGNIFPCFKELAGSGNALERVLALELELAEALQEKKRTDTRFQSSFLKQHSNEEAIFQSFRDINELIQDMLELKKRHATVECELQEMHGRYSQLSLQFAEVEGERQKLMMSLKNRSPRKS
ncbi:sporulation-specific protein [Rhynchospora pubera]|uniref:Sporulation-specific protein n=1 Tax=Rhynchospora pubera TaxID=906938 RepID=A0AAV8HRR5_9POAL|nr:sporulation-specific protein [Rhynchospora pubera]